MINSRIVSYVIGGLGSKLMAFILLPVYSYYLAVNEMGRMDYVLSLVALLIPVVGMQLSDAAYRWMIAETKDSKVRTEVMYDTLLPTIIMCVAAVGVILLFSGIEEVDLLVEFSFLLVAGVLFSYFQQLLRGVGKFKGYAVAGFIQALLILVFSFIVLAWLGGGVKELIMAHAIGNSLAVTICLIILKKDFEWSRFSLRTEKARIYLLYSVPLMANAISWWLLLVLNRVIVVKYLGYEEGGIYAMAARYSNIASIANGVILMGIQDRVLAWRDGDEVIQREQVAFNRFVKAQFVLLMILSALSPLIMLSADNRYYEAWVYMPILFAGSVMSALAAYVGLGYQRVKNTNEILLTTLCGALFSVVFTVVLISSIGLYASSIGTLMGFTVMLMVRQFRLRGKFDVRVRNKSLVKGALAWLMLYALLLCLGKEIGIAFGICSVMFFGFKNKKDLLEMFKRGGGDARAD